VNTQGIACVLGQETISHFAQRQKMPVRLPAINVVAFTEPRTDSWHCAAVSSYRTLPRTPIWGSVDAIHSGRTA
jgi:hypothetical protein